MTKNESTLPTSTKEHNKMLDAQIADKEPPDYDAPWFERRYFATAWSTVKAWLGRQ
jgi:hypothetical protein